MIYVVATVILQPHGRERFLLEVNKVATDVRDERGCLEYSATVDIASGHGRQIEMRPDVVTIVERWSDLEALKAHSVAPHMLSFRQRCQDLVISTSLQVLAPV